MLGEWNGFIPDHEVYMALGSTAASRCQAYPALVHERLSNLDVQAIRDHVNKGCVLGSARFQDKLEAMLKRWVTIRSVGRPRKQNEGERSGRQGCNPTGESQVVSIARVGHVAIPHLGAGNQPSDAWGIRPGRPEDHLSGGCNLGVEQAWEPEHKRMTAAPI